MSGTSFLMGVAYLPDDLTEKQKQELPRLRAFLEAIWSAPSLKRGIDTLMIVASLDAETFSTLKAWSLDPKNQTLRSECAHRSRNLLHVQVDLDTLESRRATLPLEENVVVYSSQETFTGEVVAQEGSAKRTAMMVALNEAWGWTDPESKAPFMLEVAHRRICRSLAFQFSATVNVHKDGQLSLTHLTNGEPLTANELQARLEQLPTDEARCELLHSLKVCLHCGALTDKYCYCQRDD